MLLRMTAVLLLSLLAGVPATAQTIAHAVDGDDDLTEDVFMVGRDIVLRPTPYTYPDNGEILFEGGDWDDQRMRFACPFRKLCTISSGTGPDDYALFNLFGLNFSMNGSYSNVIVDRWDFGLQDIVPGIEFRSTASVKVTQATGVNLLGMNFRGTGAVLPAEPCTSTVAQADAFLVVDGAGAVSFYLCSEGAWELL